MHAPRDVRSRTDPLQRLAEHYKDQIVFVKLFGNANRQTKDLFKGRFQVGLVNFNHGNEPVICSLEAGWGQGVRSPRGY